MCIPMNSHILLMPKHRASVLAIRLFGEHSYTHEGALCFACFPYPQCVTDSSSQLISWHLWSALPRSYQTKAIMYIDGRLQTLAKWKRNLNCKEDMFLSCAMYKNLVSLTFWLIELNQTFEQDDSQRVVTNVACCPAHPMNHAGRSRPNRPLDVI